MAGLNEAEHMAVPQRCLRHLSVVALVFVDVFVFFFFLIVCL